MVKEIELKLHIAGCSAQVGAGLATVRPLDPNSWLSVSIELWHYLWETSCYQYRDAFIEIGRELLRLLSSAAGARPCCFGERLLCFKSVVEITGAALTFHKKTGTLSVIQSLETFYRHAAPRTGHFVNLYSRFLFAQRSSFMSVLRSFS